MPHCPLIYKLLLLTLSFGRDHYRTSEHIPKVHAAVFAIPAVSASLVALIEAIMSTSAAILVAKAVHDWCEVRRLQEELQELKKELEEELEEAESEVESALEKRENDESSGDEDADEQAEPKTVEDILEDAEPGEETKGKSTQWEKDGGYAQAKEDFDSLQPEDVFEIDIGWVGTLKDGRQVIVRWKSEGGRPTLEIQEVNSRRKTKIRYNP